MTKIILCGYEKTGTSWALFVAFNYFNIFHNKAKECILWNKIIKIVGGYPQRAIELTNIRYKNFEVNLPYIYYTHTSIHNSPETKVFFRQFDGMVYTYRNPFDTLISLYHYIVIKENKGILEEIERVGGLKYYKPFDTYVRKGNRLTDLISHIKHNRPRADLVLYYDKLRRDTDDYRKFISFFIDEINEEIYQKALEFSSFENIYKIETKEGVVNRKARDGRVGQYKEVMNEVLINYIKNKCEKEGIIV